MFPAHPALARAARGRMGFVRRYWLQVAGVVVGLGIVAAIGVFAFRGSGGSGTAVRTSTTASAAPSATADPRVAEVKAAVRAFIAADVESAKTGDATLVHALAEPGSAADDTAGVTATISHTDHHNFITTRIDYADTSWHVVLGTASASADVDVSFFGHDATWPSLQPTEQDHETQVFHDHFELVTLSGKWLVSTSR
jgi:hypothetical protein